MSANGSGIDDDDKALFRQYVEQLSSTAPADDGERFLEGMSDDDAQGDYYYFDKNQMDSESLGAEDVMSGSVMGAQTSLLKRLKRGAVSIEGRMDLHQCTIDEAASLLPGFIKTAKYQQWRCVLIIHGKGHFSKEPKPVLKNMVYHFLMENPDVLAYHSAKPKHGGAGAVYVMLKSSRG